MTIRELTEWARCNDACGEGLAYLRSLDPAADAQVAWDQCQRGDWLLWWAGNAGVARETLVLAICSVWREVAQPHVAENELRPLRAVETAEAWCCGEATLSDVMYAASASSAAAYDAAYASAYSAAHSAYDAAYAAASASSAAAAAYAASSAYDAADAAYAASSAYDDAAAAYAASSAYDARLSALNRCAEIVRENIPAAPHCSSPQGGGDDAAFAAGH